MVIRGEWYISTVKDRFTISYRSRKIGSILIEDVSVQTTSA